MSYITREKYPHLTPEEQSKLREAISKEPDEYCLNEYELSILCNYSVPYLRKLRSQDRGFPFFKDDPISTNIKPLKSDKRKNSSSAAVRYALGAVRDKIKLREKH